MDGSRFSLSVNNSQRLLIFIDYQSVTIKNPCISRPKRLPLRKPFNCFPMDHDELLLTLRTITDARDTIVKLYGNMVEALRFVPAEREGECNHRLVCVEPEDILSILHDIAFIEVSATNAMDAERKSH